MNEELTDLRKDLRPYKEFELAHADVHLGLLCLGIQIHLEGDLRFSKRKIATCLIRSFLLANLLRQREVEFGQCYHLVARIHMTKHDLLRVGHWVLVMEDEEGVGLHVYLHRIVGENLQPEVKVDHAKLCNQGAIRLAQLD